MNKQQADDSGVRNLQNGIRPYLPWIFLCGGILLLAFYFVFDPMKYSFMPKCLFHQLTGLQCMGCGSQRMLHALLHGNIAEAFRANALATLLLPLLGFFLWLELSRLKHPRLYARVFSTKTVWTLASLLILWMIIRNIFGW